MPLELRLVAAAGSLITQEELDTGNGASPGSIVLMADARRWSSTEAAMAWGSPEVWAGLRFRFDEVNLWIFRSCSL